jgi:flagellar motor switch protein FliN/FliY
MSLNLDQILKLDVPIVVRLGERHLPLAEILRLVPGAIIELPKDAESELDLLVNNREVGCGRAVKVGENFGIRITYMGELVNRLAAATAAGASGDMSSDDAAALAEAFLAGQT